MSQSPELAVQAQTLQNLLVSCATGGSEEENEYAALRQALLADPTVADRLPTLVRSCRSLGQFWAFIKRFETYQERREYLWEQFRPLLDHLEGVAATPADQPIDQILQQFDTESVHRVWRRALKRRMDDPEGAITLARTLLETVCKHILDDSEVDYPSNCDLPKLYHLVAEELNLGPAQHTERLFKQILGGCKAVVEGLAAVRNRLSDAHGKGKKTVKPRSRHAELAVNLAGSMATFLVQTWQERSRQMA